MKKIVLTIAALTLSTSALAEISSGNPDLQGWAVEDRNLGSVQATATRDAPMPFGTEDQYGGILFNEAPAHSDAATAPGVGDSYGSILHSVGFDW